MPTNKTAKRYRALMAEGGMQITLDGGRMFSVLGRLLWSGAHKHHLTPTAARVLYALAAAKRNPLTLDDLGALCFHYRPPSYSTITGYVSELRAALLQASAIQYSAGGWALVADVFYQDRK